MEIMCEEKIIEMVRGAKDSDGDALERLIEYYTPYINSRCRKFNINGFDNEDIISEGVWTLIKCVESYSFGSYAFTPYFFRALSNELNYLLRKSYRDEALGKKIYSSCERGCDAVDVEDKIYKETLRSEISEFMKKLTEVEREVVSDVYFKEKSMAEVARNMECPFHKVQHIRNVAIRKLRRAIG